MLTGHLYPVHTDEAGMYADSLAAQPGAHKQSAARPTVLFCGDLNCGLNHGTPGVHSQTCHDSHRVPLGLTGICHQCLHT